MKAFSSFPDSMSHHLPRHRSSIHDSLFSFRIPDPSSPRCAFLYGFVFNCQRQDERLPRGGEQKSVVILSHAPTPLSSACCRKSSARSSLTSVLPHWPWWRCTLPCGRRRRHGTQWSFQLAVPRCACTSRLRLTILAHRQRCCPPTPRCRTEYGLFHDADLFAAFCGLFQSPGNGMNGTPGKLKLEKLAINKFSPTSLLNSIKLRREGPLSLMTEHKEALWSTYSPTTKPDTSVLNRLIDAGVSPRIEESMSVVNNEILWQHFLELTTNFLVPFGPYLRTTTPSEGTSPFVDPPLLPPFHAVEFINGLAARGPGKFLSKRMRSNWLDLYRRAAAEQEQQRLWRQARMNVNIEKLMSNMSEIERIDSFDAVERYLLREMEAEIEKVKKIREERAIEKAHHEEEMFHFDQSKVKSEIRLREGRTKPIDVLLKNLNFSDEFDIELNDPYLVFKLLYILTPSHSTSNAFYNQFEEEDGSFSPQLMHGNEYEDAIDPEEDKAELVEFYVSIF
uniref:Splicing factor cactin central domain-containing protein n=1 Tax=Zea mays TaxID=4577 RepID=A0A804PGT3_MAIZE